MNAARVDCAKVLAVKDLDRRNRDALVLWRLGSLSLCQVAENHVWVRGWLTRVVGHRLAEAFAQVRLGFPRGALGQAEGVALDDGPCLGVSLAITRRDCGRVVGQVLAIAQPQREGADCFGVEAWFEIRRRRLERIDGDRCRYDDLQPQTVNGDSRGDREPVVADSHRKTVDDP